MMTAEGNSEHFEAFDAIEKACADRAGKNVAEQFWDDGKQKLQPIIMQLGQFYQNVYGVVDGINHYGQFFYPLGEDGTIPSIDLKDVGEAAAALLIEPEKFANPNEKEVKILNVFSAYLTGGQMAKAMMMHCKTRDTGTSIAVKYAPTTSKTCEAIFEHAGMERWAAQANVNALDALISDPKEVETRDLYDILCRDGVSMSRFCKRELSDHITPLADFVAVDKPMLFGFGISNDPHKHKLKAALAAAAAEEQAAAAPAEDTAGGDGGDGGGPAVPAAPGAEAQTNVDIDGVGKVGN